MQTNNGQPVFMSDSHIRSVVKGITWRITGTIDTICLALIVTGTFVNAVKIGFTEVFTKVILYYLHERIWNAVPYGRIHGVGPTHARSLVKGISWRALGTLDTIVISYFITGQWISAIKIGVFEIVTKIVLFYLHERVWGRVKWGRIIQKTQPVAVQTNNPEKRITDKKKETVIL